MNMKYIFIIIALFLSINTWGQHAATYSRVKINLNAFHTIELLDEIGIAADHGTYLKGRHFTTDLSQVEVQLLSENGFDFEILIEDAEAWYANPNREELDLRGTGDCQPLDPVPNYPVPENFEMGSMGGYFTWQEMLAILDEMKALYPDLISTKLPIEGELTFEGRPIHWVRISDNPEADENEPEVLYTALHHSREPGSLTQLIFYMWYLLENYETDEQIRYLIDETEMYFIPCVNPDGYVYNELNNPEGGGLWRKNRFINGDGSHGVDLNRNYGYEWGHDNEGSSTNPLSETYRGTAPFSEPETRAVRDFCNEHQFQIALNYHTHGDLLVHPWSYSDSYTPDHETFSNMARAMIAENSYLAGTTSETVGYAVNGDSDDWMYGEQDSKPEILAFTPEVGASGGFWPAEDQIVPNAQKTLLMNLRTAALVHRFGIIKDNNPVVLNAQTANFYYSLQRIGLQNGPMEVRLSPISDNVNVEPESISHDLNANESIVGTFSIDLDSEIQNGDTLQFYLSLDNGSYTKGDTITKIFINNIPAFSDSGPSMDNWQIESGLWATTGTTYYSAPMSITDSPNGVYANNVEDHIVLQESIELGSAFEQAFLNFWAKWEIEPAYDYAQVAISVNSGDFIPLCGRYSKIGTDNQDEGNPLYDGFQQEWVEEMIDITEFAEPGDDIKIRFSMVSDGYLQEDGFYFDEVSIILTDNSPEGVVKPNKPFSWDLYPVPASEQLHIEIVPGFSKTSPLEMAFFDALGKIIFSEKIELSDVLHKTLDTSNWQPGFYICKISSQNQETLIKRVIITH
ncbi:MAG: T9SS C-terminal target domain-containing protein [Bacteroidetes bacterium]|nr:MAG: T9SS C-terminal target domain-containing protein [Bacteroidota bacterium]